MKVIKTKYIYRGQDTACEWCGGYVHKGEIAYLYEGKHGTSFGCSPSCAKKAMRLKIRANNA